MNCLFPRITPGNWLFFVTELKTTQKALMYKEVVVSTSLKENTINIWDIHSCTNIFEFKENVSSKNG